MSPTTLWLAWQETVAAGPDAPAVIEARDGGRVCTRAELTAARTRWQPRCRRA